MNNHLTTRSIRRRYYAITFLVWFATALPLSLAVQMDHVSTVNIDGDTSFALSLEAQRRGHRIYHYTPDRLSLRDGKVIARIEEMTVRDVKGDHFTLGEPVRTDLQEMDVILLRQDPPFDMNYITTTHILERIHPRTLVVNDPNWVRNSPEKIFVTEFPDLMPQTLITRDAAEVAAFRKEFGDSIIKPIDGNGGADASAWVGKVWDQSAVGARKMATDRGNQINTVAAAELKSWEQAGQAVYDSWISEVSGKGYDGKVLLKSAQDLIRKYEQK